MARLLEPNDLMRLVRVSIDAELFAGERRSALLAGLPMELRARLPDASTGNEWLLKTLDLFNRTPWLDDGITCPLRRWLCNALELLGTADGERLIAPFLHLCEDRLDRLTIDPPDSRPPRAPDIADADLGALEHSSAPPDVTAKARERLVETKRAGRAGPALKEGDLLSRRFVLVDELGVGGYATVWRAWDVHAETYVAVKVLQARRARDRTHRERFLRGARQMGRIEHPGIVRIIEPHCRHGDWLYVVMELIRGGDLQSAVVDGRVTPDDGIQRVLEVADALDAAHARRLVHRDVKPGNILIREDGRAVLTDFDLVRAPDTTGGTEGALGSPLFAAPEMYENADEAGPTADVYGLGMTLAFVLHRRPLTPGLLRQHEVFISTLDCSEALRAVVHRATRVEPAERHPHVQSFATALRRALDPNHAGAHPQPAESTGAPHRWPVPTEQEDPRSDEFEGDSFDNAGQSSEETKRDLNRDVDTDADDPSWWEKAKRLYDQRFDHEDAADIRHAHRHHEDYVRRGGFLVALVAGLTLTFAIIDGTPEKLALQGTLSLLAFVVGVGLVGLRREVVLPGTLCGLALLVFWPSGTLAGVGLLALIWLPAGWVVLSPGYREIMAQTAEMEHDKDWISGCLTILIGLIIFLVVLLAVGSFSVKFNL